MNPRFREKSRRVGPTTVDRSKPKTCIGTKPCHVNEGGTSRHSPRNRQIILPVVASGIGVTYRWKCNGTTVKNATSAYLKITLGATIGNFTLVASNTGGNVESPVITAPRKRQP